MPRQMKKGTKTINTLYALYVDFLICILKDIHRNRRTSSTPVDLYKYLIYSIYDYSTFIVFGHLLYIYIYMVEYIYIYIYISITE